MSTLATIKLQHPVKCGEDTIHELTLRLPTAGDLRGVKSVETPFSMILDLSAELADVPPAVIDRLSFDDFGKVTNVVSPFLGKLGLTGNSPSA